MVKNYIYVGKILTNKNELKPEFEKRIMNENRAYYILLHVLKSQSLLRAEKIKIHKTNGNNVAESWTMREDIVKWPAMFERNVFKRMFMGIKVNENCRK